jgi:hypothetical protein
MFADAGIDDDDEDNSDVPELRGVFQIFGASHGYPQSY